MGTLSSYWAAHQGPNADMEERSSFLFPPSILSLRVGDEQRIQGQLTSVAYLLERLWRKSRGCRDSSALLPIFWRNCKERAEDAGTAQLCCLPFRETVKKLWHCFAAGNMWDATVKVWLHAPSPGKERTAATESFSNISEHSSEGGPGYAHWQHQSTMDWPTLRSCYPKRHSWEAETEARQWISAISVGLGL